MSQEIPNDSIFAIGDIHGCVTELRLLLNELPLTPTSKVIFLGDYIDRGPHSKEVIDTILELQKKVNIVTLVGNHEQMFLSFLEQPQSELAGMFIYNGGGATLASYSDESADYRIPSEHLDFFKNLRIAHQEEGFYFVHAGVPEKSLKKIEFEEDLNDLLWIREPFLSSDFNWGIRIIHGHTPVKRVDLKKNRINLDTGCVFNRRLSALGLPSCRVFSAARQERGKHIYLQDVSSSRIAIRFQGHIPVFAFKEGRTYEFETLDYNEFGVYMRDLSGENHAHFDEKEVIEGIIGSLGFNQAPFKGQIVRVDHKENGHHYAVKMDQAVQVEVKT